MIPYGLKKLGLIGFFWNLSWPVTTFPTHCAQLELSPWVDCCYQPKWRRCQDSLDLDKGVLSSPYYPNYYEPFQECSWLISVPENFTVTLEFKSLSVSFTIKMQWCKRVIVKYIFLDIWCSSEGIWWKFVMAWPFGT